MSGTRAGKPDLQLQLFELRWGTAARGEGVSRASARRDAAVALTQPRSRLAGAGAAASGLLQRSTVLIFASTLFPDTLSPVVAHMAVAGYLAATGSLLAALAAPVSGGAAKPEQRQWAAPRTG